MSTIEPTVDTNIDLLNRVKFELERFQHRLASGLARPRVCLTAWRAPFVMIRNLLISPYKLSVSRSQSGQSARCSRRRP